MVTLWGWRCTTPRCHEGSGSASRSGSGAHERGVAGAVELEQGPPSRVRRGEEAHCRMDLPGPTTSVGTRTDYSVGPWDYLTCAARHLMV
jgi:hypothetical protein